MQTPPHRDLKRYDHLRAIGVNRVSFCFEIFDPQLFREICPGKHEEYGLDFYLEAIRYCAQLGAKGPRMEPWVTNGEIIAGLEPIENTIDGIERIVSAGAFPTVCIFRPTTGSDMEDWPAPGYDDMRTVMAAMYDACRRHWLPIGVAPNIEVSLVVNPDDAALLATRDAAFYSYELWRRSLRFAARPVFRQRLRPGRVRASA